MLAADAIALLEHPDPHPGPHADPHAVSDATAYANASKTACVSDATGHATGHATAHASTEIRDLDLCTSKIGTSSGTSGTRSAERSAAAPHFARVDASIPSPLSTQPATDGNYAVIERLAHEALDELRIDEPSADAVARVKELCAARHIDYGEHVGPDVVHRAVESAAVQRVLKPATRRRSGEPTSVGEIARGFQRQLEALAGKARGER